MEDYQASGGEGEARGMQIPMLTHTRLMTQPCFRTSLQFTSWPHRLLSFRSRTRDRNQEYEKEKKGRKANIAEHSTMPLGKPTDELKLCYITLNKFSAKQERRTERQLGLLSTEMKD